jgi:hypothetical protein
MTIIVDFTQLHPAAYATWTAIARLVTATNTQTWAVVGGQMVAIHATVWGVEVPRATDDGDIVVDVRTERLAARRRCAGRRRLRLRAVAGGNRQIREG